MFLRMFQFLLLVLSVPLAMSLFFPPALSPVVDLSLSLFFSCSLSLSLSLSLSSLSLALSLSLSFSVSLSVSDLVSTVLGQHLSAVLWMLRFPLLVSPRSAF